MKVIQASSLRLKNIHPQMEELSQTMSGEQRQKIDTLNWKGYDYKPEVQFAIAYSETEIFLKYFVKENYFKAEKTESNQNVFEDSCVEFFVSPEPDGYYYNFEFNAIGTCLMGSGHGRADSVRADLSHIAKIRRFPSLGSTPIAERKGDFSWDLTIAIPYEVLFHHNVKDLRGKSFRANFYKCGDKLSVPHYVSWNPIGTEKPDFHRPEYFGEVRFL